MAHKQLRRIEQSLSRSRPGPLAPLVLAALIVVAALSGCGGKGGGY